MVNIFKTISTSLLLRNVSNSNKINCHFLRARWNSTANCNYTIKEIQIPLPKGHYLSGKLWETNPNPNTASSNSNKKSPIICVHGWLDNAGTFDPLLTILFENAKEDLTVLAIDGAGHGLSSHTALTHYDTFLDGMLSIVKPIKYMGWEKVTLMGHSLGSIISFIFAGSYPELVDRYIALDVMHPVPSGTVDSIKRIMKSLLDVENKLEKGQIPTYTYDQILQRTYDGRKGTVNLEGCKTLLKRGSVQLPDGKYSFTHDLRVTIASGRGRFSAEQVDTIGAGINCPVCVIKAEPGGVYEPRENFLAGVDRIRKNSRHVELHFVPGTHHYHLNEPELVAPIITNFLDLKF